MVQRQSNGLIRLASVTKKNGQEAEFLGAKIYVIEYEAKIEFLGDCYWGGPMGQMSFETIRDTPGPFNAMMFAGRKKAAKGQTTRVTGTLRFEKTEKGWRGQDGKLY